MLLRALRPFTSHPDVDHVVVTLPPGYAERPPDWLGRLAGERLTLVAGGETRAHSVAAGLKALRASAVVLVHDAARPFVVRATIDAVIARARTGVAAIAALPVSDTVKEVTDDTGRRVARTVPRERLWRAQTPQGFPRDMLDQVYAGRGKLGGAATDDAELCERVGLPVDVVPDSPHNLKVTTAEDFRIAEALARELRCSRCRSAPRPTSRSRSPPRWRICARAASSPIRRH